MTSSSAGVVSVSFSPNGQEVERDCNDLLRKVVSQIFASWNRLAGWLRLVDHLRVAALRVARQRFKPST